MMPNFDFVTILFSRRHPTAPVSVITEDAPLIPLIVSPSMVDSLAERENTGRSLLAEVMIVSAGPLSERIVSELFTTTFSL
ncbi:hypothetical protein DSECCO2_583770 [anaerobic digester metagenome]